MGTAVSVVDAPLAATHIPAHISGMKTTMDIPDALYRDVKAEAARRGTTVREVTTALYEAWLRGELELTAPPPPDRAEIDAWLARLDALAASARERDTMPGVTAADQVRRDRDARD